MLRNKKLKWLSIPIAALLIAVLLITMLPVGVSVTGEGILSIGTSTAYAAGETWLTGWSYRKLLTIDETKVDAALTNFPVLVKLSTANFDFGKALSTGFDIRFTSSDGGTLLKYERERHDAANSLAEYWVKIPSVASDADTLFYIYYGKADATDGADPTNVWDSNFKLVTHLNETSGTHYDATANNNDGTPYGDLNQDATGKVNGADDFDGINDAVVAPDAASLDIISVVTIEAWIYSTEFKNINPGIVTKWDWKSGVLWYRSYSLYLMTYKYPCVMVSPDGAYLDQLISPTPLATNTWYYLVGVSTGSKWILYINGALDSEKVIATAIYSGPAKLSIGSSMESGSISTAETFKGTIDEARVSDTVRSAAWIKASYESERDHLLDFGAEEALNIEVDPESVEFGFVSENSSHWSKTGVTGPNWADGLNDDECLLTVTNLSSTAVDISIKATDFTSLGVPWTLTSGSPGQNTVRMRAGKSGDAAEANMVTLTTSNQLFISSLAASGTKKWEIKLETGTFTDGVPKSSTITLTATF